MTKLLPENPAEAVQALINVTKKLTDLTEQELNAFTMKDDVLLVSIMQEKENMAVQYEKAAAEFKERLEDFRNVDKGLLKQLEEAQEELAKKASINMKSMPAA